MMTNPFSIKDKIILITGASSGIGRVCAIECAKMGAKVICMGRNIERLEKTYESLIGDGHRIVSLDLNNSNEIIKFVTDLEKIDGVINSAGVVKQELFNFLKEDSLQSVMNTNFFAPILFIQKLIKKKKIKKGGSIVLIASLSGPETTFIGSSAYSASKAAITGVAKAMALELANKMIRVNCVLPGMIRTNLLDDTLLTKEDLDVDEKLYPLQYGNPDDVAFASIYLLSGASKWVTGTNLKLDGGFTLK